MEQKHERQLNKPLSTGSARAGYTRTHDGEKGRGHVPDAARVSGGDSPMIRKTALAMVAAASLAMAMTATASTATAGAKVQFHFGAPAYGYGYHVPYGHGYHVPVVNPYACPRVFVGYRQVHTRWGWKTKPVYRRHCG
jgi:hypothetical protein